MTIGAREYAELAKDSYEDRGKGAELIVDGSAYKVIDVYRNPVSGYSGIAYRRIDTREVVIAHRGTQTNWGAIQDGIVDGCEGNRPSGLL